MKVTDADNVQYWDNVRYWEDRGHGGCRVVSGVRWLLGRGLGRLFWLFLQYTDCRLHSFNLGIVHPKGNLHTCTAQKNLLLIAVLGFFFVVITKKKKKGNCLRGGGRSILYDNWKAQRYMNKLGWISKTDCYGKKANCSTIWTSWSHLEKKTQKPYTFVQAQVAM